MENKEKFRELELEIEKLQEQIKKIENYVSLVPPKIDNSIRNGIKSKQYGDSHSFEKYIFNSNKKPQFAIN